MVIGDLGFRVQDLSFLGFRVLVLRLRVGGLGLRAWGLRFQDGLGVTASGSGGAAK